jgi:hypothetical protein
MAGDARRDPGLELGDGRQQVGSSWTWVRTRVARVAGEMPTGAVGAERSRASSAAAGVPPR